MKRFVLAVIILFLLLTLPAAGQAPASLQSLAIKLWPEYDDPRLLVIIDGRLTEAGQIVAIPVPADAFINAVATAGDDGNLINTDWTSTETPDGGSIVTLTPENPFFRVEYYVPIETSGAERRIRFNLPAGYVSADKATVEVLLPPSSSNIRHEPALETPPAGPSDAVVLQRNLGAVEGTQEIRQEITYDNPTGALTIPDNPAPPPAAEPAAEAAPIGSFSPQGSANPLIIGLAAVAVLLIAAGAYGLWRTRLPVPEPEVAPVRPADQTGKRKRGGRIRTGRDRFCRQCGKEFGSEDRFCRYCGTRRL
ncbi:MAG: zinc ribbon domain-containing protein [Caldilineae bacterium]|nr:MAG: zinc ribbon domain-containing protein [Caldilineae bacterium]